MKYAKNRNKISGAVQELEMEIKDFNLLIGEQATGAGTLSLGKYTESSEADYEISACQ